MLQDDIARRLVGRARTRQQGECEGSHQAAFFVWLFYSHKDIWDLAHHIPNGGLRNKGEAIKLKRQGVKKGVWDVFIPWPTKGYHGLYIEFKFNSNKLTPEQEQFGEKVRAKGYATEICYSVNEAVKAVTKYLQDDHV